MKLKIENIGMIRHADIRLDGLTIIAGENDTGKSTVGKLIFSLVKAFNRYDQDLNESKSARAFKLIERIYFRLRQNYDFKKIEKVQELFIPPRFSMELHKYPENISEVISERMNILNAIEDKLGINDLNAIEKIYSEDENKAIVIMRALNKALFSEFYSELTPKNSKLTSSITVFEGKNIICRASIKNDKVNDISWKDELFFNEVTYVETPIFLQMNALISSALTLFEMDDIGSRTMMGRSKVSLHTKDLILKIKNSQYYLPDDNLDELLNEITKITKGRFSFDEMSQDFFFNKDEKTHFRSSNTATGIKSFGVIQLLIQANVLNERSLLIIDEPEIHLHPKWQVEYAKLIVALVKNDIPVLLTSHSPEIIHALTVFSEKFGIQDRTAYYLTESDGTVSDINDVTGEINKIFIKLTEPLHDLLIGI
jgi:predicted ATPase